MRLILTGLIGSLLLAAGCGSNVKVTGKVTFEDGQPLAKGRVCFQTDKFFADGPIQKDGTYTLGSVGENTGLPKGTYQVFIAGAETPPQLVVVGGQVNLLGKTLPGNPLVHKKFTDRMTSGLTCEVKGRTVFDITVMPP